MFHRLTADSSFEAGSFQFYHLRPTTGEAERAAPPDRPSIAVLPFTNMSGDSEQEYFSDGITEDIITALTHWRSFPVIARNSTFTYKNKAVDIKQAGREFGARHLLEGSVRKGGHRVRARTLAPNSPARHRFMSIGGADEDRVETPGCARRLHHRAHVI